MEKNMSKYKPEDFLVPGDNENLDFEREDYTLILVPNSNISILSNALVKYYGDLKKKREAYRNGKNKIRKQRQNELPQLIVVFEDVKGEEAKIIVKEGHKNIKNLTTSSLLKICNKAINKEIRKKILKMEKRIDDISDSEEEKEEDSDKE
jgi:hypothetical protein